MLPNDLPPWEVVYQHGRRWLRAGCFEAMVSDMRSIMRVAEGRQGQPSAVMMDGRTMQRGWTDQGYTGEAASEAAQDNGIDLQIVRLPEAKGGFVLLPRHWAADRSFGWLARFRWLSRDYERLPEVLGGCIFRCLQCSCCPPPRVLSAAGSSRHALRNVLATAHS